MLERYRIVCNGCGQRNCGGELVGDQFELNDDESIIVRDRERPTWFGMIGRDLVKTIDREE